MKKVLFTFAMLICFFASCSDGGSDAPDTPKPTPQPEEQASITMATDIPSGGLVFDEQGGEKSVEFSANKDWTLSIAATTGGTSWCTASEESGSKGDVTVKFTVAENTEYDDRSVSVTIKAGTASKTFKITQKGVDALLVTTTTFEVPQEGGTIDVEVKANIEYQFEVSETAKAWITEANSRALTTQKHSFAIATSEESEKREGEIYIKSGDKLETVKVYQAGGAIILLSTDEYTVSDAGETISVEVKSNVEFGVQMPDVDWIVDEASSRGMSSHTLQYTILPNETYDGRSAEIVFYDKNSDLKETLTITQAQKDAIVISKKEFEVKAEGETIEVKLSANVDFEVTMPEVEWISQVESRALTEHTLYFKVAKNAVEEERRTEIVFANKDSQLSEKITITQQGVSFLQLTKDEFTISDAGETIEVEIKSNVEYGIQMPEAEWISQDVSEHGGNVETLKFIVDVNETYDSRSAEIIFYDKNSDLKDTLKVLQAQKDAIVLSKTEYNISVEGGALDFEVSSNVDFETEISVEWIKQVTASRGLEARQLHFTVDKNTGGERKGTITFIYGDIKQVVNVCQQGGEIPYITFTADALQSFSMSKDVNTLEYSVDYGEWKILGTAAVAFGGEYGNLRLRGKNIKGTKGSTVCFGNVVPVACTGDIRTLLDYENYTTVDTSKASFSSLFRDCSSLTTAPSLPATTLTSYCYAYMFCGCSSLTTAPVLPATRISTGSYEAMFYDCSSLTTAPVLPATDLSVYCYQEMFYRCSSLTSAPALPATELFYDCYHAMFSGCSSLTTAPVLPATSLESRCYKSMFSGCSSLTTAPVLPATTLAEGCYTAMFSGCSSLTTAPVLPATTLAKDCYYIMFSECSSLTTAPVLPATSLDSGCYNYMFNGCTSLTEAPELPATVLASSCYSYMFNGCTSLNEAPILPATILATSCYSYMFSDCSSLTTAPALPATTLAENCYESMFSGCSGLTTAPVLPALSLTSSCYRSMFNGCTNLNAITMLATDISASRCLYDWLKNVSSAGTFTKAASMTSLPSGSDGIPSGWTVVDYTGE